jgi:hypothetical protein
MGMLSQLGLACDLIQSSKTLSTSAIFSSYFTRGYGWGQVVPNGFGVAYMTGFPDRLLDSFRTQYWLT